MMAEEQVVPAEPGVAGMVHPRSAPTNGYSCYTGFVAPHDSWGSANEWGPSDWGDTSRRMVGIPPVRAGGHIFYLPCSIRVGVSEPLHWDSIGKEAVHDVCLPKIGRQCLWCVDSSNGYLLHQHRQQITWAIESFSLSDCLNIRSRHRWKAGSWQTVGNVKNTGTCSKTPHTH